MCHNRPKRSLRIFTHYLYICTLPPCLLLLLWRTVQIIPHFSCECISEFVCLSVLQYFKYPLIIHRPASQWDGRKVIKTLETADKTDFMPIDTHTTKPEKPSNKSKNPRRSILLFIFIYFPFCLFSLLFLICFLLIGARSHNRSLKW